MKRQHLAVMWLSMMSIMGTSFTLATAAERSISGMYVFPKQGQSAEQQYKDEEQCHTSAIEMTGYNPSAPSLPNQRTMRGRDRSFGLPIPPMGRPLQRQTPMGSNAGGFLRGAVGGAALGASTGAITGDIEKKTAAGAVRGAIIGAALARKQAQQQSTPQQQQKQEYQRAFSACMEARNYSVK